MIEAAPDDPTSYLVYADWLQTQDDPRGQLIALQHARKNAAANKLLDKHAAHFFGDVTDHRDMLVPYPYGPLGRATTWRWGYLEAIWIANKYRERRHDDAAPKLDVAGTLATLLDHPSARFVRELTVGIVTFSGNNSTGAASRSTRS